MCSVFQTCQTAAASSRVWLLWKLVISRFSFGTLSVWRSGLLVYNVVFIVGPNRLGTGSTWAETTWGRTGLGPDRTDTRILPTRCGNFSVCFRPSTRSDILLWNKLETPVKISTEFWTLEISALNLVSYTVSDILVDFFLLPVDLDFSCFSRFTCLSEWDSVDLREFESSHAEFTAVVKASAIMK